MGVEQGRQRTSAFEGDVQKHVRLRYLVYLPRGYDDGERTWPFILFLHGAGERGEDIEIIKRTGLTEVLERRDDLPFVVVAPQCPTDGWWDPDELLALLDHALEAYRVDRECVYLTGLSMGGFGTWRLASQRPELFAAIAPICGGGNPALAHRLREVPIWAFHGAKDEVVPLERSQEMVDAVNEAGGHAKLTVYPDAGHDSWTPTYNNPELYTWLLEHSLADRS